ncbi:MAG TPA: FCD domain-containing protein, partial [Ktedonobacteraceae bacterium]|nr:FCD domain-containing protein [Ktedonobacteraceae bacterium]
MSEKLHRETLAEQARNALLDLIARRGLREGDVLPSEMSLAGEFGVSRQVIREALKAVQGQGVIEILNGRGAVVRPVDHSALVVFFQRAVHLNQRTIIELIEVRKGIEIQSAMLAAERRTAAELTGLQELVARMDRCLGDVEQYSELDLELHLALAAATHNAMLFHLISSLREVSRDTILAGLRHRHGSAQLARVQQLHVLLLAAIERGDSAEAGRMMARHF